MELHIKDNLKGMKLIYTLIFLLSALVVSAQNDSIYSTQKIYHIGDTLKMVFKSKTGSITLMSDGACSARLMMINQFKKPTGWAEIYQPAQMDCGEPFIELPNGVKTFYPQMHPGTYRMVFFANGKPIETEEFRVE